MSAKKMKLPVGPGADVIAGALSVGARKARPLHEPKARTKGADKVAMTIFAPAETHEKLRELAAARHTSLQQIVAAAVDLWLMREGQAFSFYPPKTDEGRLSIGGGGE